MESKAEEKPGSEAGPGRPRRRRMVAALAVVIAAGGGMIAWRQRKPAEPKAGAPGPARGMPAASVTGARATRGSIGVYLTGLGAVTPLSTVTVRSRVDGELIRVHYTEGQMVKQGDPLAEIDPRPYEAQLGQLQAQLARDRAVLENARLDLRRYEELAPKKAVTAQTLATQKATVAQNEGTIQADEAQIAAVRLNITYSHIVAPTSGRVGLRLVDQGNYVQAGAGTSLAVITQMDPISVIFTLTEDQLTEVLRRGGRGAGLAVEAYDREMRERLARGRLTTIDNQIDQTTGTVKLRATFDNARGVLFPNQFVNARLLLEQRNGVTLLPTAAIQRSGTSAYVYLVRPDQTAVVRPVKLGVSEGDMTEVLEGVAPGDVVAVHGVDRLQDGSKVQVRIAGEEGTGKAAGGRS